MSIKKKLIINICYHITVVVSRMTTALFVGLRGLACKVEQNPVPSLAKVKTRIKMKLLIKRYVTVRYNAVEKSNSPDLSPIYFNSNHVMKKRID